MKNKCSTSGRKLERKRLMIDCKSENETLERSGWGSLKAHIWLDIKLRINLFKANSIHNLCCTWNMYA